MRIYPVGSSLVDNPLNELLQSLTQYLTADQPTLTLSVMTDTLLINGEELTEVDRTIKNHMVDLAKVLSTCELHSISFKSGITKDELKNFIEGLAKKQSDLKTKDIEHILLDQVEYMAVMKTDDKARKVFETLNNPAKDMPEVMSTLGKVYNMMDNIQDSGLQEKIQERIANYLSHLQPTLLKDILEKELPPKIEKTGIKETIVSKITKEHLGDIYREVIDWCQEIKSKVGSEMEFINQLTRLKDFIGKFLKSPASRLVSVELYEELFRVGVLEEMPPWIEETKKKKESLLLQIDVVLEKESTTLLESSTAENLPEVVEKLCQLGMDDTLAKLMDKMADNLSGDLMVKLRKIAVDSLIKLIDILKKYRRDIILGELNSRIIESVSKEIESEIYTKEINILSEQGIYFISLSDYDISKIIVHGLKKFSLPEYVSDERKQKLAKDKLLDTLRKTKTFILADLVSNDSKKQSEANSFILLWGEESVSELITLIRETEDLRIRKYLTGILKSFESACRELSENLNLGVPGHELRRIVEVSDEFDYQCFIEPVQKILPHVSPQVKRAIINYLAKIGSLETKPILISLLHDPQDYIKEEVVRIIYDMDYRDAVDELMALLPKVNPELQKEICTILGNWKQEKAVPLLIKILKKKPRLWGLIPGVDPEVRVSACWALGNFPLDKAKKAVFLVTKDKNKSLRIVAQEVLRRIQRIK